MLHQPRRRVANGAGTAHTLDVPHFEATTWKTNQRTSDFFVIYGRPTWRFHSPATSKMNFVAVVGSIGATR